MSRILVNDCTLRDGSHAIGHRLNVHQITVYSAAAEAAGVPIIEVGHGNGLGASSLQLGESLVPDQDMLMAARTQLVNSKLGILVIPGFATIKKDLGKALEAGVDVVRVASHCTEADITERHISYVREKGKEVYGVLMLSHMASKEVLLEESRKMELYGAEGVILMDSAGAYLPQDIYERISLLVNHLTIPVGFHAHNNLGLAIANSLAAIKAGAAIVDGTARGFGAGAGNAQLEVLVAVLEKLSYSTGINLYKILDAGDLAEKELLEVIPSIKSISIISGLAGVFSAFAKPVERIAKQYGVDPRDIYFELGRRQVVGGQEDIIIEVADQLSRKPEEK